MRKARNYILRNWLLIVAGCIIQTRAVQYAYNLRGEFEFGGEMFILLGILVTWEVVRLLLRNLFELLGEVIP